MTEDRRKVTRVSGSLLRQFFNAHVLGIRYDPEVDEYIIGLESNRYDEVEEKNFPPDLHIIVHTLKHEGERWMRFELDEKTPS